MDSIRQTEPLMTETMPSFTLLNPLLQTPPHARKLITNHAKSIIKSWRCKPPAAATAGKGKEGRAEEETFQDRQATPQEKYADAVKRGRALCPDLVSNCHPTVAGALCRRAKRSNAGQFNLVSILLLLYVCQYDHVHKNLTEQHMNLFIVNN